MDEKKSLSQRIIGKWDTKTVVGVAIGAALFGVLMRFGSITVFTNTSLTTAMLVNVIVGALFGPLPAAVSALCGNMIADLIGGWGFWMDWSVGNAVAAFFVGMLPLYGALIDEGKFEIKHVIFYIITVIVGNALAFGVVTPVLTYLFYSGELTITFGQAWASLISNASVEIIVGIPLIYALAKRNKSSMNLSKED